MTISFDDITQDEVNLGIAWEQTYITIPIQLKTQEVMAKRIKQAKKDNALGYHMAGYYYLRENIKLTEAKNLMETAILLNEKKDYRNHLQLAYILEKLKDRKGAIKEAKKSLEIAKSISSKYGIEENTALLKKWDAL